LNSIDAKIAQEPVQKTRKGVVNLMKKQSSLRKPPTDKLENAQEEVVFVQSVQPLERQEDQEKIGDEEFVPDDSLNSQRIVILSFFV
jgi:hypothetical protein